MGRRVMSFKVLPFGSTSGPDNGPVAKHAQEVPPGSSSAEVVDLASRRPAVPDVPEHVWEEVEAASQLWRDLRCLDREIRFETDDVTGGVVASLCDLGGGVVRPLPLRAAVITDDPGPGHAA
jgi:hypothetical protein